MKKRWRWFSAAYRDSEDWLGPYKTMEDAVMAGLIDPDSGTDYIYLSQGYKMSKAEREDLGMEQDWFVDTWHTMIQVQVQRWLS